MALSGSDRGHSFRSPGADGLAEKAGAKVQQALETCQNLFHFNFEVPSVVQVLGAGNHLAEKHHIVVFDTYGCGACQALAGTEVQTPVCPCPESKRGLA